MAFGQFGEVEKMKKDKEWLKSEIEKMGLINTGSIFRLIDELDNKAVLSQEWVEEHKYNHYIGRPFVYVDDLQNLLMSKQDKPVIPQFVADCIEYYKRAGDSLGELLAHIEYDDVLKIKLEMLSKVVEWVYPDDFSDNEDRIDLIARAWLDGFTVKKEKLYRVRAGSRYVRFNLDGSIIGAKKDNSIVCLERLSKLPFDYKKAVESGIITLEEVME